MRTVETKKITFAILAVALVVTLASVSYIDSVSADCEHTNTKGNDDRWGPSCNQDPDPNEGVVEDQEAADEAAAEAQEAADEAAAEAGEE